MQTTLAWSWWNQISCKEPDLTYLTYRSEAILSTFRRDIDFCASTVDSQCSTFL
ncbi:hypothetical protein Mapa_009338 [Marchantia paleacea]|nr:hypothetical protein Mapa_009338 [Marchantia paleacea]